MAERVVVQPCVKRCNTSVLVAAAGLCVRPVAQVTRCKVMPGAAVQAVRIGRNQGRPVVAHG